MYCARGAYRLAEAICPPGPLHQLPPGSCGWLVPGRTSALQAAALGVPKPLRQLILRIRRAWSTHKHPTPNPGPP